MKRLWTLTHCGTTVITSLSHHQLIGQDDRLSNGYETKTTQTPFSPTAVHLPFVNQLPHLLSHRSTEQQCKHKNQQVHNPPHFRAILGKSERKFSTHPQEAFSHRLSYKICMRFRAWRDLWRWSMLTTAKEKWAWGIHPWRPPGA